MGLHHQGIEKLLQRLWAGKAPYRGIYVLGTCRIKIGAPEARDFDRPPKAGWLRAGRYV
jgi:hypothetical protein